MSLISEIDKNLLLVLSGANSSSARSTNPTASLGTQSSAAAQVNLSEGLYNMEVAFSDSFVRLNQGYNAFQGVQALVGSLEHITGEMISLARRAADSDVSNADRGRMQSRFQRLGKGFVDMLDRADQGEVDLLEKTDLKEVLEKAGINTSQASELSLAFSKLAPIDGDVGYTRVPGEDVTLRETIGGTTVLETAQAPSNPLNNRISTRAKALVAENQLQVLLSDIQDDAKQINTIVEELSGALEFAYQATRVANELQSDLTNLGGAEDVVSELISRITKSTRDTSLGAHSSLDTKLAADLLR